MASGRNGGHSFHHRNSNGGQTPIRGARSTSQMRTRSEKCRTCGYHRLQKPRNFWTPGTSKVSTLQHRAGATLLPKPLGKANGGDKVSSQLPCGQGFGTPSGGFLIIPSRTNNTPRGPAGESGWEDMPTMPTMPTDAYRCLLEICAGAQSVCVCGGVAWRAAGAHRGNCSAFIEIASSPVKARAHVS